MGPLGLWQLGSGLWKWGQDKGTSAISGAVEQTILFITQIMTSGYAIILGFPGYLLGSIVNSTVGELDPVRTPRTIHPGVLIVGMNHSLWRHGLDLGVASSVQVTVNKTGFVTKVGRLGVPTFTPPLDGIPGRIRVGVYVP
jgi:hypothetical protein